MIGGVILNIYSLILIFFLNIIFFAKPKTKNREVKIYKNLLLTSFFMNLSGLLISVAVVDESSNLIFIIVNKLYLAFLIIWIVNLTYYVITTAFVKDDEGLKKLTKGTYIFAIICVVLTIVLPLEVTISGGIVTIAGSATFFAYLIFMIGFLSQLIIIIIDVRHAKSKKYIPVYLLAFLGVISVAVIMTNQSLNYIINPVLVFIIFVMYNTIENPDLRIVEELAENRNLIEESIEEKSNLLFEISQEVRNPITKIREMSSSFSDYGNKELVKQEFDIISNEAKQVALFINNILDITTLNSKTIMQYANTYNPKTLFESIDIKSKKENPNINFDLILTKSLPRELYGDQVKLKQIVLSVISNAVSRAKDDTSIELKVNCINKYDMCRLIIFINDTGNTITLEMINDILNGEYKENEDNNLNNLIFDMKMVNKIIKDLGGYLMISSNEGKGTEVKIAIDQKVENSLTHNSSELKKSVLKYIRGNKVAIVSNKSAIVKKIKKLNTNLNVASFMFGEDLIKSIEADNKFDVILLDDEMKPDSGYTTLMKLKEIKKFDIPVIILLEKNKESIKEHYLKDGFNDYILFDNLNEEIKKIDKYI